MKEIWIDVKSWEEFYQISNFGRIKCKKRRKYSEKVTLGSLNPKGYYYFTFTNRKIKKRMFVHRIVAFHFLNNKFNFPIINHIDGNPKNNHYSNLEWCDYSYNQVHAMKNNMFIPHTQKLSFEIANIIRKEYENNNISQKALGKKYNLARTNINKIINNRIWKTH